MTTTYLPFDVGDEGAIALSNPNADPRLIKIIEQAAQELGRLKAVLKEIAEIEPANPYEDKECQAIAAAGLEE